MAEHTLLEGAAFFIGVEGRLAGASKVAVTRSARLIRDEAKRVLGTYDYGWPSLAESTIERKMTGDSPGLETGAMRSSIKYSVSGHYMDWTATVGTNDIHALWFELGTSRGQPPRSFLAGAAMRMEHRVHEICGRELFHTLFHTHVDFEDDWSYDGED